MLLIRRAEDDDATPLQTVVHAAYAPVREAGITLPPVEDGLATDIRDHLVWVAEDGQIVGGLVASLGDVSVQIRNLAVHPDAAGRGVARGLIGAVEAWAAAASISRLDLTTHVAMTQTQALYRHLGWSETGRDGDRVHMAKPV